MFYPLKGKRKKKAEVFFFLFVICVFLGIVYDFTTKFYNEELDITSYWSWWPFHYINKETVNIFSAEPDGNYNKIMQRVIQSDSSQFKEGKPKSSGGYENPNRVMLDPLGIAFVKLVDLRQRINTALNEGKLNTDHFNDLLVRTDHIMDKLRKSLFLRLHELFNREDRFGGISNNDEQVRKLLLKYVTSNYLNFDDYKKLTS